MVRTYETYQSKFGFVQDDEKVDKLQKFGYPQDYVCRALEENESNYCTAGYYLLEMD